MPPKKDSKSGASSDYDDAFEDTTLSILLAKREAIFVQNIFDLSSESDISTDLVKRERFLDESSHIDLLRNEFKEVLDKYNSHLLKINPSTKPD